MWLVNSLDFKGKKCGILSCIDTWLQIMTNDDNWCGCRLVEDSYVIYTTSIWIWYLVSLNVNINESQYKY